MLLLPSCDSRRSPPVELPDLSVPCLALILVSIDWCSSTCTCRSKVGYSKVDWVLKGSAGIQWLQVPTCNHCRPGRSKSRLELRKAQLQRFNGSMRDPDGERSALADARSKRPRRLVPMLVPVPVPDLKTWQGSWR